MVAIRLPLPGSRNDCRAFIQSGVDRACRGAPTIADVGYQGTGLLTPHRKQHGQTHLSPQQEAENAVHRRVRARVAHALSRLKNWKILHTRCLRYGSSPKPFTPGTHQGEIVATSGKPWSSPDGTVSIIVPGASTVGDVQVVVITPSTSCPETSLAIGEALIIPEDPATSWTRITPLRAWTKETPGQAEFPDIYVRLQIDQGTGPVPRGKRRGR